MRGYWEEDGEWKGLEIQKRQLLSKETDADWKKMTEKNGGLGGGQFERYRGSWLVMRRLYAGMSVIGIDHEYIWIWLYLPTSAPQARYSAD